MNLAIIHDDFIQYGGAERLIAQMLKVFPQADIFTACYDKQVLKRLGIPENKVTASFLQKLPLKKLWYKPLFFLYPLAFEHLSACGQLDRYQLVISSTTRFAHGIVVKPATKHLIYLNSPGRAWWYSKKYFSHQWQARLFAPFAKYLRYWDKVAVARADMLIANSENIANKAQECYGRKADAIIYPPCQLDQHPVFPQQAGYFLLVSRLTAWKRLDIAITAFQRQLSLGDLVVVGAGKDLSRLKRLAKGASNIRFVGNLTNRQLAGYYRKARALIVTQDEDFGLTPAEAFASGTPVIAYRKGGAKETVASEECGVLFDQQTPQSLTKAIKKFGQMQFSSEKLRKQADKFSFACFAEQMRGLAYSCLRRNDE